MNDVSDYAVRVGKRLRTIRQQRGLSLAQVEEASCGRFGAEVIRWWEVGCPRHPGRGPRVDRLAAYAEWLGLPLTTLLPPEDGRDALLEAAARLAAGGAVSQVTTLFGSVTARQAKALLVSALTDRRAS